MGPKRLTMIPKSKKRQKTKKTFKIDVINHKKLSNWPLNEVRLIPLNLTSTSINLNSIWLWHQSNPILYILWLHSEHAPYSFIISETQTDSCNKIKYTLLICIEICKLAGFLVTIVTKMSLIFLLPKPNSLYFTVSKLLARSFCTSLCRSVCLS